jgi:putative flavoprotein involved in K+ transport
MERCETLIIGAGQAGLAVAQQLRRRNRPFVILDANDRTGDSWRQRWDSLRLITPAWLSGLPGWRFPAPRTSHPSKNDVAGYLEAYASRFDLQVRHGMRVDSLSRHGNGFMAASGDMRFMAGNVVVATGPYQRPRIPSLAAELDPSILQIHARDYRRPSQLHDGGVLVVGRGNSGAEIALEVSGTHRTWLSGPKPAQEPTRPGTVPDRLLTPLIWFTGSRVLNVRTPIGRRVRPKLLTATAPVASVRPKDLTAAGVEPVPRTVGVRDGLPVVEDDRALPVANVIWCTGFEPDFDWIDIPVFDADGQPEHDRGVVVDVPGLYFVGLFFLSALTSSLIGGAGRDAARIAAHIASRPPRRTPADTGASSVVPTPDPIAP